MLNNKLILLNNYIKITSKDLRKRFLNINRTHLENKVFFDLRDVRLSVYYFHIIHSYSLRNYKICVKNNIKFIANCIKIDKHIFDLPGVQISYFIRSKNASNWHYFFDRFVKPINNNWKKKIFINCDVYSPKPKETSWVAAPFSMAPHQYLNGDFSKVKKLRSHNRLMKILFSGNTDVQSYSNLIFKDFYNILNRVEIISELKEKLDSGQFHYQIPTDSRDYLNKVILLEWTYNQHHSSNLDKRIANSEWLLSLSKADFFLGTPGVQMPLCFNIIEAMSVGAIPILEYPNQFMPGLEHMKNCIVFAGKKDLIEKIEMVLSLPRKDIETLRDNVVRYYDKHLYPGVIPDLINKKIPKSGILFLNATQSSYDDYLRNQNS